MGKQETREIGINPSPVPNTLTRILRISVTSSSCPSRLTCSVRGQSQWWNSSCFFLCEDSKLQFLPIFLSTSERCGGCCRLLQQRLTGLPHSRRYQHLHFLPAAQAGFGTTPGSFFCIIGNEHTQLFAGEFWCNMGRSGFARAHVQF